MNALVPVTLAATVDVDRGVVLKVEDVRGTKYGKLIGGSYSEVGRGTEEQLRLYAGEKCLRAELWKRDEGFGFRGVLRPRAYFADLVPVKD